MRQVCLCKVTTHPYLPVWAINERFFQHLLHSMAFIGQTTLKIVRADESHSLVAHTINTLATPARGGGVNVPTSHSPPPRFGGQCPVGASIKWLQNTPFLQPIDWSTHPLYLVGHGYQAWGGGAYWGLPTMELERAWSWAGS